jgi:hypothetical protein
MGPITRRRPRRRCSKPPIVRSNDKKRARIDAMRYVLAKSDYDDKDTEVVGEPDPLILGRTLTDGALRRQGRRHPSCPPG